MKWWAEMQARKKKRLMAAAEAERKRIKIGDVVRLKTGGPSMIVGTIEHITIPSPHPTGMFFERHSLAWCEWYDKNAGKHQRESFLLDSLERIQLQARSVGITAGPLP